MIEPSTAGLPGASTAGRCRRSCRRGVRVLRSGALRIVEGSRRRGRPLPRDRSTPMTGGNLTRDEAAERARLLTAEHYAVELDLTRGDTTFGSKSTITFGCSEPGAAQLRRPAGAGRAQRDAQRRGAGPRRGVRRRARAPERPAGRERRRHRRRRRLQPHRRGSAPLRRPGGRRGVPLHPVRARRLPAAVRQLRAARPQGRASSSPSPPRRSGGCGPTRPWRS